MATSEAPDRYLVVAEAMASKAIEEWYSRAWHEGARLSAVERARLAQHMAQRIRANAERLSKLHADRITTTGAEGVGRE